jgi:Tol biopolymer transport system component
LGGKTANGNIYAKVLNTPPVIAVPDQTLYVGGTLTLDTTPYLSDNEDDVADLVLSIITAPDPAIASCSVSDLTLACSSLAEGQTELELKLVDTNGGVALCTVGITVERFATMPDFGRLAINVYSRTGGTDYHDLWRINSDGSDQTFLTGDSKDIIIPGTLKFSPSGDLLAYLTVSAHHAIMDLDGAVYSIASVRGRNRRIDWAGDNSHFLFGVYNNGIWRLNSDNTDAQIYQTPCFCDDHEPVYSPDESQIAFVHHEFEHYYFIRLMDSNGTNLVTVDDYNSHGISPSTDEPLYLQWFPDGNRLMYKVRAIGLIVVDLVQSSSVLVVTDEIVNFKLSPDGTKLVYAGPAQTDIHLVDTVTWQIEDISRDFCSDCKIVDYDWVGNEGVILAAADALYYYELASGQVYSVPFDFSSYAGIYFTVDSIDFALY